MGIGGTRNLEAQNFEKLFFSLSKKNILSKFVFNSIHWMRRINIIWYFIGTVVDEIRKINPAPPSKNASSVPIPLAFKDR